MVTFSKFKAGIFHPNEAIKYLVLGHEKYLAKKSEEQIEQYKLIKEYNKKNSKYPLYFDLCKRILTDSITNDSLRERFFKNSDNLTNSEITQGLSENLPNQRLFGLDHPTRAHTMIGLARLENLQFCVEDIILNNVEGDLIETGVWRGGATIFMRIILKKYGIENKIVYAADSFEGLPKPNIEKFPEDAGDKHYTKDNLKVSLDEVKNNFKLYGVLDEQVKFMKGFFEETMKNSPIKKLSILRLDGDMYGSTWIVLENLYEKLSVDGYLIIDDYSLTGCQKAIYDFRKIKNIKEPIVLIDGLGAYWKKQV
jgi:hypothetical protein